MLYKPTLLPIVSDSILLPTLDITILRDICQFDKQTLVYHVAVIFKYLNTSEILYVFFFSHFSKFYVKFLFCALFFCWRSHLFSH